MSLRLLLLFLLQIIMGGAICQNIEAQYSVEQSISITLENGTKKKVANLEYSGFLFRKGDQYMYYRKPIYLNKYPEGSVSVETGPNNSEHVELYLDTIQDVNYKNFDSLVFRHRWDMSGKDNVKNNYIQSFEPGFQEWKMTGETRDINGLKCQKATLDYKGEPGWEVWFCADIPCQGGPSNIFDLPGLVVEASHFPLNQKYKLLSYSTVHEISADVFWPAEFAQPFIQRRAIKRTVNK